MTLENLYFFIAGATTSGITTYVGYSILNMHKLAKDNAKKALEKAAESKKWENAVFPRLENMF